MTHPLDARCPWFTTLVLVVGAVAQQPVPVAYPLDSVTGAEANCAPLGQSVNGTCNEARAQILIPEAYLPSTGGVITGIEVALLPPYAATVTYEVLDLNVGLTSASWLSPTFDANLPSSITVLSLRPPNSTITYALGTWTPLTFATPFPYGGAGNLVLEFRKSVMPGNSNTYMQVPSDPRRWDLPRQINTIGAFGSGAINASTASGEAMPLRLRLWFQDGRSLTVHNAASGLRRFEFTRGSLVTMTVHGQPGDVYASFVDFYGLGFVPPWSFAPVQGRCHLNVSPPWLITVGQGLVTGNNVGVSTFSVPNDPYFVGKKMAFQAIVGTLTSGLSWTPATDAIVNW